MGFRQARTTMYPEVNDYLRRRRAIEQEALSLLVEEMAQAISSGSTRHLNGRRVDDLVDPSLLAEWQSFASHTALGPAELERVRAGLQYRLSSSADVVVDVRSSEDHVLNFSFAAPVPSSLSRPVLTLVRNG